MADFSKDKRHQGKSREDVLKEIQKLLLQNDYSVSSVFETTKYMGENLQTNIEWILSRKDMQISEENRVFMPKEK